MTPCPVCHDGMLEQQRIETSMRRGDGWIVVSGVPAIKCDLCGETTFSQEVSERLVSLLTADPTAQPVDFVSCPRYEYDASSAATATPGATRRGTRADQLPAGSVKG